MNWIELHNNASAPLHDIPVLSYEKFCAYVAEFLNQNDSCHCVSYYAFPYNNGLKFIACIADDSDGIIYILSHEQPKSVTKLASLSKDIFELHIFEREIHENFGIDFIGHPWLKPVRYAHNRANLENEIKNYPFFKITGEALHQVGVGPIHAGVIEPGHFRFICNGENVLHLEIQLGYQHKGIERLFLEKSKLIQRAILAESIAGDTVVGHSLAFAHNMEQLLGLSESKQLAIIRSIALELERIAVHIGDLSAMCLDVAYQLGSSVFGSLRTPVINYFQWWCGNRFARTLIRPGYNPYPLEKELIERLKKMLDEFEIKFDEISKKTFTLPSVLSRFEKTGQVTAQQMKLIGAVGIPARITGIRRDIRTSHPSMYYTELKYQPVIMDSGDVYAHGRLKSHEISRSISYIRRLLGKLEELGKQQEPDRPNYPQLKLKKNYFSIDLVEGWRGEICHTAITDQDGNLMHYKVKDPSMHNWLGLALAVRNNEISDFPICNKSFDLSYCGHDL